MIAVPLSRTVASAAPTASLRTADLYVTGGQQRRLRPLRTGARDWYEYQQALGARVNPARGTFDVCVAYTSPPDVCAAEDPIILFKSSTLHNNRLYTCTPTEVLIYALPHFERVGYLSLPCFNDLHHVRPTPDGHLLVANTGLDMVLEVALDGRVLREWSTLGEDPWARFSRTTDYRMGISTKPHRSHPNHVFYVGEDIWVTRFEQKDALCLTRPDRRIAIGIERPHDGVLHNGWLYFTTVNGHVVIANPDTLQTEAVINLNALHDEDLLLGWCRGILVERGLAWVGFSRLRPTALRDNVSWVKNNFRRSLPTHLGLYDLERQCYLAEMDVEAHGLNAIFSICPAAQGAAA